MIIAIDGPSGAGKSTVAKTVAKKLRFRVLDTGAMYRCVAWQALHDGVSLDDSDALSDIADRYTISFAKGDEESLPSDSDQEGGSGASERVFMGDVDVTDAIRTSAVDDAVSPVSAIPGVRKALVAQQRRIGKTGDFVVEGRDVGTTVFPDAELKIFLTASDEARAHRRVRQNIDRGVGSIDFDEVLANLRRRDRIDSSRATSPLRAADDAITIDSTDTFIEQVIDEICDLANKAQHQK